MNSNTLQALGVLALLFWSGRVSAQSLEYTSDFATTGPGGGQVFSLAAHDDGTGMQLYVGGDYSEISGDPNVLSSWITRWDGTQWTSVGWGIQGTSVGIHRGVQALAVYDSGTGPKLYAGGEFELVGSAPTGWIAAYGICAWDGSTWSQVGMGANVVRALLVHDDGSGPALYAGGSLWIGGLNSCIGRWDGQAWTPLGNGITSANPSQSGVLSLCAHDDGTQTVLVAGGRFNLADGQSANGLASWDGTSWTVIPHPFGADVQVLSVASWNQPGVGPTLYVAVAPASGYPIWQFQNGTWTQIGSARTHAMRVYDDGNGPALFAAGNFAFPSVPTNAFLARWDGAHWSPVGRGANSGGRALVSYDFGEGEDMYVGGEFVLANGQLTHHLARFRCANDLIESVCSGHGGVSECPCDTIGAVGHGCPNFTNASGAELHASGATSNDTLAFTADQLPPAATCIVFQGDAYGYSPLFVGDGLRCATGTLKRLYTKTAVNGAIIAPEPGDPSLRAVVQSHGDSLPSGAVRYYQVWYRDRSSNFCVSQALVNMSNGIRLIW
jgi:hypothetical protein